MRKWLRAESEPNVTDLRALCEATTTSIAWLVNGSGESALLVQGGAAAREGVLADCALLEALLERVDAELAKAHLVLASTQRSALIVTLYQLFREKHTIDAAALTRLVRLAQA